MKPTNNSWQSYEHRPCLLPHELIQELCSSKPLCGCAGVATSAIWQRASGPGPPHGTVAPAGPVVRASILKVRSRNSVLFYIHGLLDPTLVLIDTHTARGRSAVRVPMHASPAPCGHMVGRQPWRARVSLSGVRAQVRWGDALQLLPTLRLPEGCDSIDLLLLDGVPKETRAYLRAAEPLLSDGAVVIADNAGARRRHQRSLSAPRGCQ